MAEPHFWQNISLHFLRHYNFDMASDHPPTDMRKLRREFNTHGLWLVLFGLIVVGGGIITLIYGPTAALASVVCLLAGGGLILVIWGILTLIGKLVGED
jgi:uncharacterized membrane protein YjjP (DUF1212 family)